MTDTRSIASDALTFVLLVGFAGAMLSLSVALYLWSVYDTFTSVHAYAAVFNLVGWIALPFIPRLYRSLTGRSFSLRSSEHLGAAA